MEHPAIKVNNVSKVYRLYDKPIDRMKEAVSPSHRKYSRDFNALKNVSFEVEKGTTLGIIGTNGSGKSTILKIITGVLSPTEGTTEVNGTVSALLELGAGFNMDYTGLENIYMNGTMMGFSREEMEEKVDDILDFAEIGDFIHQPVKTYSSGMFVRLAFALAINVDPDILIVDEALSVGDLFFQAKCYKRMEEIRQKGTTVLMVTHDMGSIIKYCDRVVLLNKGDKVAEGEPGEIVNIYKKILAGKFDAMKDGRDVKAENASGGNAPEGAAADGTGAVPGNPESGNGSIFPKKEATAEGAETGSDPAASGRETDPAAADGGEALMSSQMDINPNCTEYGDGRARIIDFGICDARGELTNLLIKGEEFTIREKIRFHDDIPAPIFTYTIKDKKGTELTGTNTMFEAADVRPAKAGDVYEVEFRQRMTLQGGEYLLSMSCTSFEGGKHVVYHRLYDVTGITVISNKNTVGVYDMESKVTVSKTDQNGPGVK